MAHFPRAPVPGLGSFALSGAGLPKRQATLSSLSDVVIDYVRLDFAAIFVVSP
jgi:hypothetical protein